MNEIAEMELWLHYFGSISLFHRMSHRIIINNVIKRLPQQNCIKFYATSRSTRIYHDTNYSQSNAHSHMHRFLWNHIELIIINHFVYQNTVHIENLYFENTAVSLPS